LSEGEDVGETSSESDFDFRDTLLELIDRSQEPVDHPSPDQWIAYHRGELPVEEEARLQEHLARCRDCFDLAAGAAEFARPEEEQDMGEAAETAALWRLVRPQLDPPSRKVQSLRRPSRGFRLPTTLAALFFVALVGLAAWSLHQQSALEALRAPRANVPTFEITTGERAVLAGRELSMPAGPRMLVFHPSEDLPLYRLAIHDAATGRELSSHELRPDQNLAFNLYLPEGLRPGRYRLELLDGAGKVRETHLLRVTGD
jgi:hypothetical protein